MSAPLFVTGTDTGVGKTWVSRGILSAARALGVDVFPVKPVETGCVRRGESLVPEDGVALARAAGLAGELGRIVPHRFELAASPSLAARRVDASLDTGTLAEEIRRIEQSHSHVLVEGAGGLLATLSPRETFLDLATALRARVLVVARDALGTINHTLLTVAALRSRELEIVAIVLNRSAATFDAELENVREIVEHTALPVFGPLPFDPTADDAAIARAIERSGCDVRRWF